MNVERVTLQQNKEFIISLFFFICGFVKLMKAFNTRGISSTLACDVHVRPIKTNSKAIKIAKETTNNQ